MKLKTLRGRETRKEANERAATRGTMKRREARMTIAFRDKILTRRKKSPRLNKNSKGWSSSTKI